VAVRIRLRRGGKKKQPMYQVVAADSRSARDGKFLEAIGRYEPLQNPIRITWREERVLYWLRNGARPTDTVRSLLQRTGLWFKWSMMKRGVDQATIATEMEKWQMMQEEKRRRDEDRKARRADARRKAKKAGEATGAEAVPAAAPETPATP
jgi:small subunit ribosomal protein S16